MPKKILLVLSLLFVCNCAFANEYYSQGMKYMNSYQYSSAITQFRNAIRQNPSDYESRIELINAYSSRAAYYYNTEKNYQKALNDTRSALFYLKYFADGAVNASLQTAVQKTENNVTEILSILKPNTTPDGLLSSARQLRNQSELPSSFIVYQQLLGTKYDKEALIASGDILKVLKNPSRAIVYYEKALNVAPKDYDLLIKLGECYQEIDNTKAAAEKFNKALEVSENSTLALDKLEETWRKQIYATPSDAAAHTNLGVVYQKKGDYSAALAEYKKAEKLNPDDKNNLINLGLLYQEQKEYDMAITMYDKILFSDANNLDARRYKAECLQLQGKNDLAVIEYKRLKALSPNDKEINDEILNLASKTGNPDDVFDSVVSEITSEADKAQMNYQFAYQLHLNKKYDDAKKYYNLALTGGYKDPDLYLNLSDVYMQLKDETNAVNVLKTGHELYPMNIQINEKLKNINIIASQKVLEQAGQAILTNEFEKAITLYKSIKPETVDSLLGIASAYLAMDKIDDAILYYKKAGVLEPNNEEIDYYIASAYVEQENYDSAKMYLNKILAKKPANQNAKNLMTYIKEEETQKVITKALDLYNAADYEKAYNVLTSFISKNPTVSYGYYYRGLVYDAQKKYDLAIMDYQNAIKYDAKFDLAYYSLAVDYDMKKDYKAAYQNYKNYLKTTGEENDYTIYTKKRIAELEKYVPNLAQTK